MLSKVAASHHVGVKDEIRWRAGEIARIEGLSDAVFAFAVTLLIVSLEVPKTFDELVFNLKGFGVFAACFAQLMMVWYQHYLFYRRYNLQDTYTTVMSMVLLFVVLFYTYPLKFVFSTWLGPVHAGTPAPLTSFEQAAQMFTIYGIGFVAVFTVFICLYAHAYRRRTELALTPAEVFETLNTLREDILIACVGLGSILIANIFSHGSEVFLSGMFYSTIGIVTWLHGRWSAARKKKMVSDQSVTTEEVQQAAA